MSKKIEIERQKLVRVIKARIDQVQQIKNAIKSYDEDRRNRFSWGPDDVEHDT
jgi:hypothetical protein